MNSNSKISTANLEIIIRENTTIENNQKSHPEESMKDTNSSKTHVSRLELEHTPATKMVIDLSNTLTTSMTSNKKNASKVSRKSKRNVKVLAEETTPSIEEIPNTPVSKITIDNIEVKADKTEMTDTIKPETTDIILLMPINMELRRNLKRN